MRSANSRTKQLMMTSNHFKHFASPEKFIVLDTNLADWFKDFASQFLELIIFNWSYSKPDMQNFEAMINESFETGRNKLLMVGYGKDQSRMVTSLLA